MGRRGPKPSPTALKLARGTFRAERDAARFDAVPSAGAPAKPDDLADVGKALWDQIIGEHAARKTLGTVDTSALAALCRTWELCQASYALAKAAPTDKDVRCSYLGYLSACDKIGAKFGWTASDRANMKLETKETKAGIPTRKRA
jgi:phage terminase small subunit